MSHFVLRRIGRFAQPNGTPVPPKPRQHAPVRILSDERLAEMKRACQATGDQDRLRSLETHERQLAEVKLSRIGAPRRSA